MKFINGLQKKLDNANGKWSNELLGVLCSIRTTKKIAIDENPFMLAYGLKVVLLVEIALHTHCLTAFQETLSTSVLREALDLLPLKRGDMYI